MGKLYAGGYNGNAKLGIGNSINTLLPTEVSFSNAQYNTEKIVHACGGYKHTLILSESGLVFASGWNSYGQLGIGGTASKTQFELINPTQFGNKKVTQIQVGRNNGYALVKETGIVYSWVI